MKRKNENIHFMEIADLEQCVYGKETNKSIMMSIFCLTFNHKDYIGDALDGFVSQNIDFEYEIVIFDDASTDGTSDIIREYAQKYPKLIKAYLAHKNTFRHINRKEMQYEFQRHVLKGKYIALCEGDDFWLDNNKLQIQIDYMEEHPDCIMTVHDAIKYNCMNHNLQAMAPYACEKDLSMEEILMWYNGNVPTASMVFKREVLNINGFFLDIPSGDWALQLYSINKGRIHYFDRIMSCYRANVKGSFTQSEWGDIRRRLGIRISHLCFLQLYNEYTNREYEQQIIKKVGKIISILLCECKDMSVEDFNNVCKGDFNKPKLSNDKIVSQLQELFRQMKCEDYAGEYVRKFVKKYRHVLIMGAGVWGQQFAKRIEGSHLEFEGFVVSDGQEYPQEVIGKKVWKISNIPYKDDMGIIIAAHMELYDEMVESLHKSNLNNFIHIYDLYSFLK